MPTKPEPKVAAPAPETRPLPALAASAFAFAQEQHARVMESLAMQTLAAMGLSTAEGWRVSLADGVVVRES